MRKGATRNGAPKDRKGDQNDEMISARRGGGKRKRGTNKETQKNDNVKKKKSRVTKPQQEEETEYLEEKRNLEDLWKASFPVGTDALPGLNWDFKHLEEALEEGGFLHGKKVYVLGFAEPQHCLDKDQEYFFVNVPTVVVIDSTTEPSKELAIKSIQSASEEGAITTRTGWVPYIPLEERDRQVEKTISRIFTLFCNNRRAARDKKEERVQNFEYCLPYNFSDSEEDDPEECSTEVYIMFSSDPPVTCLFDWEFDDLEEFADAMIKFEGLSPEVKDEFKELVKDRVRVGKKAHQQARDRRAVEKIRRVTTRQASENMKLYKFYPKNSEDLDTNMIKSPFIDRFYGNAHQVF